MIPERSLRFMIRAKLKLKDLHSRLSKYQIEWNNIQILESPTVQKIQYIYLEFRDKSEATMAYADRKSILKKEEGRIDCIYESADHFMSRQTNKGISMENVLVVYKPSTSLKLSQSIPPKSNRCAQLLSLMSVITKLEKETIKAIPAINEITNEVNDDQIFFIFPSKQYVEQAYRAQPYFKHLIADKLIHGHYYCHMKNDLNMCSRCSLPRVYYFLIY